MKKFSSLLFVLLLMLASFTAGLEYPRGDVNQDGNVGIADVTCLIDYLLYGTWDDEPVTPPVEHEYVDLGLPSGTLWATCNVGADNPEDYGDYFAWGETEPKDYYVWSTYKWCSPDDKMTKYCTFSSSGYNGFTDGKTELDPEDDAAYVNWGSSWRMPTLAQQQELVENCTWTRWRQNGVYGQLVTGPNGNTIFLPPAGARSGDSLSYAGSEGKYWSRTLLGSGYDSYSAYSLHLTYGGVVGRYSVGYRYYGYSVRAVRVQ